MVNIQWDFDGKKKEQVRSLQTYSEVVLLLIQDENSTDIKAGDLVNILLLDNIK